MEFRSFGIYLKFEIWDLKFLLRIRIRESIMSPYAKGYCLIGIGVLLLIISQGSAVADPLARTESICNFGMVKGEAKKSCQVPIPADCSVAQYPGYDEPWADASKAGGTSCQFDAEQTDWKTKIMGTCEKCTTDQCSGRFSVMFNCSHNIPPANPQPPTP